MLSNSDHLEALRNLGSSIAVANACPPQCNEAVSVDELPEGAVLEVETGHHKYRVEKRGKGKVLISGHPDYCPEPVVVDFHGSVDGGSMLKIGLIAPGMKMRFEHPAFGMVRTSRVQAVRELTVGTPS